MVTIKDIAREVGVSYSTVSRALRDVPGTHRETRARILRVAEEMGYEPNAIARSLVTNRSDTLAFLLPDLSNPFFTTILQNAEREADAHGYQLLICETRWDPEREWKEIRMLSEKRVDGILLYPSRVQVRRTGALSVPAVVFGRVPELEDHPRAQIVEVDNAMGARLAVAHLVEEGYGRVAFLGGPCHSASHQVRREAVEQQLAVRGLPVRPEWFPEGEYTVESGFAMTEALLALPEDRWPDALICGNDLIALGALQCLSERGLPVPARFGVVGFDDVKYAGLPQIRLTTVRIPCEEMGRMGTRMLLAALAGEDRTSFPTGCRIVLQPELVVRRTTCRRGQRRGTGDGPGSADRGEKQT